jgi:hypothetical protein
MTYETQRELIKSAKNKKGKVSGDAEIRKIIPNPDNII